MNAPDLSPTPLNPDGEVQAELRALRTLVNSFLLAGVVLSGVLAIYFLREVIVVRRQITRNMQYIADFETFIQEAHAKFGAFAKTNADFVPIYQKYFPEKPQGSSLPQPPKP
jgi:hypothetical protein